MEQQPHPLHILIGVLALGALIFFGINAPIDDPQVAHADVSHNVTGWAWSDTTGWISMNCTNENDDTDCATSDYGVDIDTTTGDVSGTAWSQHAGWISFDRIQTGNPPSFAGTTDPGSGSGPIAQLDSGGVLRGWARALAGCENIPCTDVTSGPSVDTEYIRSGSVSGGTSFTFNTGSVDTNRLITISAAIHDEDGSLSNVTVGGNSCVFVDDATNTSFQGIHTELWYCDEDNLGSTTGDATVAIVGGNTDWIVQATLHAGVSQSGPADTDSNTDTGFGSSISIDNLSFGDGAIVVGNAAHHRDGNEFTDYTSPLTEREDSAYSPSPALRLATATGIETTGDADKDYDFQADGAFYVWAAVGAVWEAEPISGAPGESDGPGSNTGNWDGWISLSETGRSDNVTLTGNKLEGYGWGSEVVGWVQFSGFFPDGGDEDGDTILNENDEDNNVFLGDINELDLGEESAEDADGDGVPDYLEGICTFDPIAGTTLTDVTWTVHEELIEGGTGDYLYSWDILGNPTPTPPPLESPTAATSVTVRFPTAGTWTGSVVIHSGVLTETVPCVGEGNGNPNLLIGEPDPEFGLVAQPDAASLLINNVPRSTTFTISAQGAQDLGEENITITPVLPPALAGSVQILPSPGSILSPLYSNAVEFTITVTDNPNSIRGTHNITFSGSTPTASDDVIVDLTLSKSLFQEF